jgi:putative inorganic carbon (HCO3(-)) transporter
MITTQSSPQAPTELEGRTFELNSECTARLEGTGLLFVGYLALLFLEYGGLATQLPILKALRLATLLSYVLLAFVVVRVSKVELLTSRQVQIVFVLVILTALSVFWAYVRTRAFNAVRPLVDYAAFMIITMYLVDRRERCDKVALALAVIAVLLVVQNLAHLGSSIRRGAFIAPYFMGDGNDFAWGLNVMAPIVVTLLVGSRARLWKAFGFAGFVACAFGIVGTQSRGGTLALGAAVIYAWIFIVRRKILGAVVVTVFAVAVFSIAPEGYLSRISSVVNYEADNSAQGRLQAWEAAVRMALDRPLGVGAGNFNSAYGRGYRPDPGDGRIVYAAARWISPHSVYFRVLGEYGFLGLGLLLWLLICNFRDNLRMKRLLKSSECRPAVNMHWPDFLNASLVAYAISAIFLGGFAYPHLFFLTGMILATRRIVTVGSGRRASDT